MSQESKSNKSQSKTTIILTAVLSQLLATLLRP